MEHTEISRFKNCFTKNNIVLTLIIWLILLIEVAIILSIYYHVKVDDDNNIKNLVNETNNKIMSYLNLRIDEAIFIIKRNAAFFRIHGIYLSLDNYTDLLQDKFFPSRNNIQSYVWIPKISNDNMANFEMFCNKYVTPNYTIRQITKNDKNSSDIILEKANGRDYYYPITFVEPKFPELLQSIIIGLDLNKLDNDVNIIKIANNSANVTATFRINVAPNLKSNPYDHDFLLNYPTFIYPNDNNTNNILGYSSVIIHIGNIFSEATNNIGINRNDIDFFVFDSTLDNFTNIQSNNISLLYKENESEYNNIWILADMTMDNPYLLNYNYEIGLRKWTIMMKYSDRYIKASRNNLLIILPCILPIAFLLLDIMIIIFYKYLSSLREKAILEEKKANISSQMLGYVNHEIRNPLNVIKGLVCFILENMIKINNENDEKIKIDKIIFDTMISDLSTVAGSCDMLEHIITDILDIQKLDSGKLDLNNKWIHISHFFHDITKTISQKIDEKQTVNFKKSFEPDLVLYFDMYRMKQILLNFLTNAIKYTVTGEIILKIEKINDSYRFSVSDTGRGIREEAKSKIFQPFNQTNLEDASRYGGIGLGLYLCKMLAGVMHGTIGFESVLGSGSVFWVEFPEHIIKFDNCVASSRP